MRIKRYNHCIVYWQGPGNYMVNDRVVGQTIVVGGFCPDTYDIHVGYATFCQTSEEAAKLAES